MENQSAPSTVDDVEATRVIPWESLEAITSVAFTSAGALLLASLLAPIGLMPLTEWSWLVGILLVGLVAVVAGLGLAGLYPRTRAGSHPLAFIGVVSGVCAGVAGLVLVALSGLSVGSILRSGSTISLGTGMFSALAFTVAAGYALGFLLSGLGAIRSAMVPDRTGYLLTGGGAFLLIPVVGELIRLVFGVGLPPWVIFPVVGVVALDTLAVGINLRLEGPSQELPGQ